MVGVDKGAEVVKRFGLSNPMKRVLPSALGATEEPLIDMVSAYSTFSNLGVRVKPHLIRQVTDADGNPFEGGQWDTESYKVITPYVAAQMQDMMRGVVTGGTGGPIMGNKELAKRMICGKTGTVNDFTDAWFIGYTPTYTAGVWIGYPGQKRTLGNREAGGVAALPMWMQFMEKFLKDKPNDKFPKAPPPDKEVLARRGEAERAIRKAAAEEAEANAQAPDATADQAKSAAKDAEEPRPKTERPVPRMIEPDGGLPPKRNERPRVVLPPVEERNGDKPKKRGKNG
jgi:penicillin-binding protein 1A